MKPRNSTSKKVDKPPTSYTLIRNFLFSFKTLNPKVPPDSVIPDLDREIYKQGVNEEKEWSSESNKEVSTWTLWAQHHAAKHRSDVQPVDINDNAFRLVPCISFYV